MTNGIGVCRDCGEQLSVCQEHHCPTPCPGCVNLRFVEETLRIATERYQKAERLAERYKVSILALLDSMKD